MLIEFPQDTHSSENGEPTTPGEELAIAKCFADRFWREHGAPLAVDDPHYTVFSQVALCSSRRLIEKSDATLARFAQIQDLDEPDNPRATHAAADVGCDRWTPEIRAAFYVGLALGLKLARTEE